MNKMNKNKDTEYTYNKSMPQYIEDWYNIYRLQPKWCNYIATGIKGTKTHRRKMLHMSKEVSVKYGRTDLPSVCSVVNTTESLVFSSL